MEAEVAFQPPRTLKPFTGLDRNTVVWKPYAGFGSKARHSRPESNKTPISDNPYRIPPLSRHYPVTIWRRKSESHCITASSRRLQTPSNSTVSARSPVKSGSQRSLRKSRTILPIAFQNFLTILPVSFYWSFYWRSLWFRRNFSGSETLSRSRKMQSLILYADFGCRIRPLELRCPTGQWKNQPRVPFKLSYCFPI